MACFSAGMARAFSMASIQLPIEHRRIDPVSADHDLVVVAAEPSDHSALVICRVDRNEAVIDGVAVGDLGEMGMRLGLPGEGSLGIGEHGCEGQRADQGPAKT